MHITEKLNGNLDRPAIAKIESGDRGVSLEDALLLAAALNCELEDLIAPQGNESVVIAEGMAPVAADCFRAWLWGARPLAGETFSVHSEAKERLQAFRLPALRRTLHALEEAARSEEPEAYRSAVEALRDRTLEQQVISGWSEDPGANVTSMQEELRQMQKKLAAIEQGRTKKGGSK